MIHLLSNFFILCGNYMAKSDDHLKVIEFLKINFVGKKISKDSSIHFFLSDSTSLAIWTSLLQSYYNQTKINLEDLYKSNQSISRPTINKFIGNGVYHNYISKINDEADRRKKNMYPTHKTINDFEKFVKELKIILK